MTLRTIKGTPCCQGHTQKKAWRNPHAPMAQCKRAAQLGFVTCESHRHDEERMRGRLTADRLTVFGTLVPL